MRVLALRCVVLAAMVVAACSDGVAKTQTITVELTEFAFTPKTIAIPGGQKVALELVNKGAIEHDLVIDAIGLRVVFRPGQHAVRSIGPFPAGTEQDLYCSLLGHKESGMVGKVVAR